jgi:hypothetical protein
MEYDACESDSDEEYIPFIARLQTDTVRGERKGREKSGCVESQGF